VPRRFSAESPLHKGVLQNQELSSRRGGVNYGAQWYQTRQGELHMLQVRRRPGAEGDRIDTQVLPELRQHAVPQAGCHQARCLIVAGQAVPRALLEVLREGVI
jgi:hypothetical protein